jgi:hypothetical protein
MRKPSLTAALLVTGLVFVATAASALGAYVPTFTGQQIGAKTTIHITSAKSDDSTAAIHILSPSAATLTQAPGTTIGTVTASVNAKAISPDAVIPLTGNVNVADPTKYNTPTDIACSGSATHTAVWNLSLTAAGQTLNVPVYVDPAPAALAALGAKTVLVTCLASPDVGAACAPTLCAKLLDVNFTVSGVFSAAGPIWISEFTPYTPGTATPNAAGTVTALGLDVKPTVTLAAKAGKGKAVLAGRVTIAGQPVPTFPVTIFSGTKKIGTAKTSAAGSFVFTARVKKGPYSLRAGAAAPNGLPAGTTGCAAIPAGTPGLGPCVSATIPAFAVFSNPVKVRVK